MHSDRGIQYTCTSYQNATDGFINSYSKKAYPWDNACIESFHALIKREWLNRFKILDYNHPYRLVFNYIDAFITIVHPQVMKYWRITPLFSYYLDKRTDLDFEWNKPESLKKLIESKVISIKEADILKGLGGVTSNKIEVEVLKAKKLYDEFFGDDNPLDVIFTLPAL